LDLFQCFVSVVRAALYSACNASIAARCNNGLPYYIGRP